MNKDNNIHTELHYVTDEIVKYTAEPKKFGMYLGIVKKIGREKAFEILSEMKQRDDIKHRGKYFMGCYKRYAQKRLDIND